MARSARPTGRSPRYQTSSDRPRYGVSWQVVPRQLPELLDAPDREAAARVMKAMLEMTKIEVAKRQEAYEGVPVQA